MYIYGRVGPVAGGRPQLRQWTLTGDTAMKILIPTCILIFVLASAAGAVVDPSTNRMSIFFDTSADTFEVQATPFQVVPAYVILTNPDFTTLEGYEFAYEIEGSQMVAGQELRGPKPLLDVSTVGTVVQQLGVPWATTAATVLAEIQVLVLDSDPIAFTLHGTEPNTIDTWVGPVVWVDRKALAIQTTFWDSLAGRPGICAAINNTDPHLPTDEASWGTVKSLYR